MHGQNKLDEAEQLYLEVLARPRSVIAMRFLALLRMKQSALGSALEYVVTAIECGETPEKTLRDCLWTLKNWLRYLKAQSLHEQARVCYDLILATFPTMGPAFSVGKPC